MDSKKVDIIMKSVCAAAGQLPDIIELRTEGKYRPVVSPDGKSGWEITYEDTETTGFAGSTTVITCYGSEYASMERSGNAQTNLIIESTRKHHCHYGTEYGDMMIGIYTHKIINRLTDDGGELYFKYTIDANSVLLSNNEIYISVSCR